MHDKEEEADGSYGSQMHHRVQVMLIPSHEYLNA